MGFLTLDPVYLWLIIMILFIVFELATMGLTTIWFAFGALAALIVAAVNGPFWLQIIVFLAASILALFGLRDVAIKYFNKNREQTNALGLIGQKGIVAEKISNIEATGRITVSGQEWSARALHEEDTYDEGTLVVVREIRGVKLIVEKCN